MSIISTTPAQVPGNPVDPKTAPRVPRQPGSIDDRGQGRAEQPFAITDEVREVLHWAADTLNDPSKPVELREKIRDVVMKMRASTSPPCPEWCVEEDCDNPGNNPRMDTGTACHRRIINITHQPESGGETNVAVSVERWDGPNGEIGETELCFDAFGPGEMPVTMAREIAAALVTLAQFVEDIR